MFIKSLFTIIMLSIITNAQDYYYSGGKKINIVQDTNRYVIILNSISDDKAVSEFLTGNGLKNSMKTLKTEYILLEPTHLRKEEILKRIKSSILETNVKAIRNVYTKPGSPHAIIISENLIIKLRDNSNASTLTNILRTYKLEKIETEWLGKNEYLLQENEKETSLKIANQIYESGLVEYSHPVFQSYNWQESEPTDQYFSNQWNLAKIMAPNAWDVVTGSSSIIIGIFDTGVDSRHPDLENNIIAGWDFKDNDNITEPTVDGHGTACAGIVSAATNNGKGVAGVSYNCKIMPIQFSHFGWNDNLYCSKAIRWAADQGVHIINISGAPTEADNITSAINYATTNGRNGKGCIFVKSAGNSSGNSYEITFPGKNSKVLCVGATDENDNRRSTSCYGDELDLMAPSGVFTTDISGNDGYTAGDYYGNFTGTSAAAPHAAGVAGLILSINNNLTEEFVRKIMCYTADDIDVPNFDRMTGWGRLNALASVKTASREFTLSGSLQLNELWWGDINLGGNVNVNNGRRLVIDRTVIMNLGNYSITNSNGTIIVEDDAVINGYVLKTGNIVNGIYPTLSQVLNAATPGQTVVVSSGAHTINTNLAVPSGVTLQIKSGVYLYFNPGTTLIVYGTLLADGARFNCSQQGSTWKGIKLIGTNSNTFIRNCEISSFGPGYGGDGIYIEDGSPVIEYNTIGGGNYNGIKVYGGSPRIEHNTIQYCNNGNGITVENSANPTISNNTIHHTYYHGISIYANPGAVTLNNNVLYNCGYITHSYTGIRVYGSTNVYSYQNNVSGCYFGYFSESSSQIDFGSYFGPNFFYINNQVSDCSYGLVAYTNSQIIAGREINYGEGYSANHNSIHSIGNNALQASVSSTIYAYDNDFGSSAPVVYKDGSSNVYWSNNSGPSSLAKNSSVSSGNMSAVEEDERVFQANTLINNGKFYESKKMLQELIDKGSKKALTALLKLYSLSDDDELSTYVESISSRIDKNVVDNPYKEVLVKMYFYSGKYELALKTADELISKGKVDAKIDKFLIYALGLRDNKTALSILAPIKDKLGNEKVGELYTLLLPDLNNEIPKEQFKAGLEDISKAAKPEVYSLSQNYPNPFNPSTQISYQLPVSGNVTLKVYNVLGKEVALLVDEYKNEGKYSVEFNPSNLPSGIYVYELRANSFVSTKKMLLVK